MDKSDRLISIGVLAITLLGILSTQSTVLSQDPESETPLLTSLATRIG
ncbi:MAG: hypothetical protein HKN43_06895 [Rhodothermales bacterium]|nr:hypothetical protein [Rhodothermales bacterium]